MYHFVCQTCEEDRLFREFGPAQERFTDHAERLHQVELVRLESSRAHTGNGPHDQEAADG